MNRNGDTMKTPAILVLLLLLPLVAVAAEETISTGPDPGESVPDFSAPDQADRIRTFADLSGPDGLLLLFYRTVDW